jgi:hypothetical protein
MAYSWRLCPSVHVQSYFDRLPNNRTTFILNKQLLHELLLAVHVAAGVNTVVRIFRCLVNCCTVGTSQRAHRSVQVVHQPPCANAIARGSC